MPAYLVALVVFGLVVHEVRLDRLTRHSGLTASDARPRGSSQAASITNRRSVDLSVTSCMAVSLARALHGVESADGRRREYS